MINPDTINGRLLIEVTGAWPDDVGIDYLYLKALGRADEHLTDRRRHQTLGKYITEINKIFKDAKDNRRIVPGIARKSYRLTKL